MRVRGERVCQSCGTRWSYYEVGEVTCPDCGSPVSVGVGERAAHTDTAAEFDLTAVRQAVDGAPREEVAERAADVARAYCRQRGFVRAGDLLPLGDTYLAAAELREVAGEIARAQRISGDVEAHYLSLLRGADAGERPAVGAVPEALRAERGRAVASSVEAYTGAVRRVAGDPGPACRRTLSRLRTHRKRVDALDGDVPPRDAEGLVSAARDLGQYLRAGDEAALATAADRLPTE